MNIDSAIMIRKNAITGAGGSPLRRQEVMIIKKCAYEGWKYLKGAVKRWIAGIVFSSLKRVLGEDLLSKEFKAQKVEA